MIYGAYQIKIFTFYYLCGDILSSQIRLRKNTHTHTHTLSVHVLKGHSIDIMIFRLYKLYILSPNPKPYPSQKTFTIFKFSKIPNLFMIKKLFSSCGPKCPHKDKDFRNCHLSGNILSP